MEWKPWYLEAVESVHCFAERSAIHGVLKIVVHLESCAQITRPHEQSNGQRERGDPARIILYECSLQELDDMEKSPIGLENDEPKNRHQEHAGNSPNSFSNPKLHSPRTPMKNGIWGLVWWVILTIMALCGNIAGTVDFAQLAGQGLASFWRFLGM
jgi:hypothetical protein